MTLPPPLRRASLALACWTGVALVFTLSRLAGPEAAGGWRGPLLTSLAEWWAWGLVAAAIPAVDRRLPFAGATTGRPLALHLAAHLAAGLLVTAGYLVLYAALAAAFGVADGRRIVDGRLLAEAAQGMYLWELLVYGLLAGGWVAWRLHERGAQAALALARLERDYADARLEALRLQLDPHFLFNALNTISAELQAEPRRARQMIEHLGELLRRSLDPDRRLEVSLAEELAFLEHYLAIQRLRFGGRLQVTTQVEPEAHAARVPSLLLQPLVENAIRHGLAAREGGGRIELQARREGARLRVSVADDGVGLPADWSLETHAGLGLAVTRERVEAGRDGPGSLSLRPRDGGGTLAEIALPFRAVAGAPHA